MVHVRTCGITGLGGTRQDLLNLIEHTRTFGNWWDIPELAGQGVTYLRYLVGHTRTWGASRICGTHEDKWGLFSLSWWSTSKNPYLLQSFLALPIVLIKVISYLWLLRFNGNLVTFFSPLCLSAVLKSNIQFSFKSWIKEWFDGRIYHGFSTRGSS